MEYKKIKPMTEEQIKQNAFKQLTKIADLMETCEPGDKFYKQLQKEYRAYAEIVMPEAYKNRKKKSKNSLP